MSEMLFRSEEEEEDEEFLLSEEEEEEEYSNEDLNAMHEELQNIAISTEPIIHNEEVTLNCESINAPEEQQQEEQEEEQEEEQQEEQQEEIQSSNENLDTIHEEFVVTSESNINSESINAANQCNVEHEQIQQQQVDEEEEMEREMERLTKQLQKIQELQQQKLKERQRIEEQVRIQRLLEEQEILQREQQEQEEQLALERQLQEEQFFARQEILQREQQEERERAQQEEIQRALQERERAQQEEIQRALQERESLQQENQRISSIRYQESLLRSGALSLPEPATRYPRIPGIENPNLLLTIHGARKLIKRSIFSTPDPFCIISIDGINQIRSTSIRYKTLNPQFKTVFNFLVEPSSIIVIQVFDHKLFTTPGTGQGFLGVINLRVGNFVDLSTLNSSNTAKFTLKSSTGHQDVRGTIDVSFKCIQPFLTPAYFSPTMSNTSSPSSSNPLQQDVLPIGWTSARDSQNRIYYINHNDRTTSWTKPSLPAPISPTSSDEQLRRDQFNLRQDSSPSNLSSSTSSTPNNLDGLPPGWERRVSPNGRPYYVDHNTSKTSWEHPNGSEKPPPTMSPSSSSFDHLIKGEEVRYTVTSQADLEEITQNSIRELGKLPSGWQLRVASNGRIFFLDHGTKNTTWDDPRIVPMADSDAPKYKADFQMKLRVFRVAPEMRPLDGDTKIEVSRQNLFYDSFDQVMGRKPIELKRKLYICFNNELGLDYGGVAREFFYNLSHEIFNPIYGLFQSSSQNNYVLQVNPHSQVNPEHLQYFYFIGLVIGIAIFNKKYLDATFVVSFYKMILDIPVALEDLESVDAQFYKNLIWMVDNDVTYLGQTFSAADEIFGEITNYDLIEGGSEIDVTEENKLEYIKKIVDFRLINRVQDQMTEIKRGIFDIIPKNLLSRFNETELEFLFCGISEIDISDWRTHTLYRKCDIDSKIICWFWEIIADDLDNLKRAQLLQFVTGTSRLPLNGFKDLQGSDGPRKFTIELLVHAECNEFPRSHTCFNRIDLPPYTSKKDLLEKLLMAIECSEGFDQK